jgi:hypothetical protein
MRLPQTKRLLACLPSHGLLSTFVPLKFSSLKKAGLPANCCALNQRFLEAKMMPTAARDT